MDFSTADNPEDTLNPRYAAKIYELAALQELDDPYGTRRSALEKEIQVLEREMFPRGERDRVGPLHDDNSNRSMQGVGDFTDDTTDPRVTAENIRPSTSDAALPPPSGFSKYADNIQNGVDGHFPSDGLLMGHDSMQAAPGPWQYDFPQNADTLVPHQQSEDFRSTSPSISGSEMSTGVSRKRQRPDLSLDDESLMRPNKSRRTTPSPNVTTDTTPTSLESYDVPEDLFALLGGNPKDTMEEMLEEQRRQEQLVQERYESQAKDEEIARAMQQQLNDDGWLEMLSSPGSGVSVGSPSQAVIGSSGRLRRPSPMSSPQLPNFSVSDVGPSRSVKTEPAATGSSRAIKMEHHNHDPHLSRQIPQKHFQLGNSHGTSDSKRGLNIEIIDLDSDSEDTPGAQPIGYTSANPITLDSDPWSELMQPGNSAQTGNSVSTGYPSTFPFPSAAQIGQSLYNSATNFYDSCQNLLGASDGNVYGSTGSAYSSYPSFFNENFSTAGFANDTFSRLGMDASMDTQAYQRYKDRVDYVTNDPTRTRAEIQSLLGNIRPDEDLPPENREGTPDAMTYPLMEHQKLGLAWLKKMEASEQKGGILADDMGLGKTIQALALIVSCKSEDPLCKTTLIVAPVALMKQWEKEIKTKLKPGQHSLKTFVLHGSSRLQPWQRLRTFDVVITTFGTLSSEYNRREAIEMKKRINPNWRPTAKDDHLTMLGDESFWYRVIIDEAQCIKNKTTKASLAATALKAKSRFCMTGTPMMNSVDELYSLVRFLRIQPWMDSSKFGSHFSKPLKGHNPNAKDQAMKKLQVLLKAILLRRTKTSVIDGKPILNLPPRSTESRHAVFSDDEQEFYKALESKTRLQFNKYLKAGTVGRHYSNILVLLLRLRQACCHPYLLRDFAEKSFEGELSADAMIELAKELAPDAVARLTDLSRDPDEDEETALECPICMDMIPNATIFIPCGHNACSECFAKITDPTQAIANGDAAETRNGEAKCPNCRGKILTSKVIDHNTFKKVHMPKSTDSNAEPGGSSELADGTAESDEDSEDDSDDDVDAQGNLKDFIVDDDATTDDDEPGYRQGATPFEKALNKDSKKAKKSKGKAKAEKPPRKSFAQLKKESSTSAKARRRYLRRLEKNWETSAKIEKTMEILNSVQKTVDPETKRPEKVIIFSQFTSLLDLLEVPIDRAGWTYRRYDGSMSANARNQAVESFTDDKNVTIMLISLKAGNSGLNLTAASQVVIFDPFWNPYIEEQAIDRAHRIGQMNPVHVHRVLVQNTVEDRILALQEKKRALIESALDEGESRRIGRLGTQDLAFLFDVPLTS